SPRTTVCVRGWAGSWASSDCAAKTPATSASGMHRLRVRIATGWTTQPGVRKRTLPSRQADKRSSETSKPRLSAYQLADGVCLEWQIVVFVFERSGEFLEVL